jgi:hypothetical protein
MVSVQPLAFAWTSAVPIEIGQVAGTSAANTGAFAESVIVKRTLPSPSVSVSVSEYVSRSPAHAEPDIAPSMVPQTPGPGASGVADWPDAQASFVRAPQASGSVTDPAGQFTVQPAQYWVASATQIESQEFEQQVGSRPHTVLQQVASAQPGLACTIVQLS